MLFGKKKHTDNQGTAAAIGDDAAQANGVGLPPAEPGPTALEAPAPSSAQSTSASEFKIIIAKQRRARLAGMGAIVNLLLLAPRYRELRLGDLEWLVLPAVMSGQYLVSERQPSDTNPGGLAAMLLWASVSPEVDRRLASGTDPILRMEPKDWRSGDIPWVIEVLGHKDAVPPLLAQFRRTVVKGIPARMRVGGPDGYRLLELSALAEAA